jgi:hypothetical protein
LPTLPNPTPYDVNRFWPAGLAVLAGAAVIGLVQIAAAVVMAWPGLRRLVTWLRTHEWPMALFSPGLTTLAPVFAVALVAGLFVFRLPGSRSVLFLGVASPFVLYSLYMNIGMLVWAGTGFAAAVTSPLPWLVAGMVPAGLLVALGISPSRRPA